MLVLTFAFEEVANGNVWSVICCRQIGWQLEFERDSNDSSHFFSVSGRALTVSGHFTTKSSFDVLHFSLSARCENASHAYTGAMPFYATTNNNCIARISCKLTIFNFWYTHVCLSDGCECECHSMCFFRTSHCLCIVSLRSIHGILAATSSFVWQPLPFITHFTLCEQMFFVNLN